MHNKILHQFDKLEDNVVARACLKFIMWNNSIFAHLLFSGGDAKLLVLLCVSPAHRYITESLQCLGFGTRARQVQRGPTKRRLPSSAEKVETSSVRPRSASTNVGPSFIPKPTWSDVHSILYFFYVYLELSTCWSMSLSVCHVSTTSVIFIWSVILIILQGNVWLSKLTTMCY